MRNKITLLSTFVVIVISVAVIVAATIRQSSSQQISELEEKERRGEISSIRDRAKLAKAKGKQKVTLPGLIPYYEGFQSLDEALSMHTVVVAQPIEKKSYEIDDTFIITWYKFKVLETISEAPPSDLLSLPEIPDEMLPLNEDEILVPQQGGSLVVDGIEVVDSNVAAFNSQEYLLFLAFDPTKKFGQLIMGSVGALAVNSDGTFEAVNKEKDILEQQLKLRAGDKVDKVRAKIQKP